MTPSLVQIKVHAPAGTIILNRPDKANTLSRTMLLDLARAFGDLHQERKVRAVVLTGAGNLFCAGLDMHELHETSQSEKPLPQWHEDAVAYRDLLEQMLLFPKPIIAAVNGPALAAGAGLVLASDVVIATSDAKFGLPDPRYGMVAGTASPLLAFRVGGSHAARLLLTAQQIDADEAHRIGLYHELVEADQAWARAMQLAQECALAAPEAIQLTKRMLNETIGEQLAALLSAGAAASATSRTTEAASEGLAAFVEKRTPKWF